MPRTPGGLSLALRRGALLLCLLLGAALSAQAPLSPPGAYSFKAYGVDQGLSNLSITAMTQDAKGYIWVGTEDGLFRLEAGRMRRMGSSEGLSDSGIDYASLSPTPEGGLWVNTRKGPFFWDGRAFRNLAALGAQAFEQSAMLALPRGGMIMPLKDYRRFLFTQGAPPAEIHGLPHTPGLKAAWLSEDRQALMVVIGTTLWIQQGKSWLSRDLAGHLQGDVEALHKDRKGRIWVRSVRGLLRLDRPDGAVEDLSHHATLGRVNRCYLVEDGLGRVWTNTQGSPIAFGDPGMEVLDEAKGLPQGGANVLLVDREGSLWMGGNGVHQQLGRFLWTGHTKAQGLPAHVVWSIARSRDGLLWIGTSGGLAVGGAAGWQPIPGTSQRQFMAFAEDGQGNLWCGPTSEEGQVPILLVHRPGRPGVAQVTLQGLKPREGVSALAWDPEGFLWMGAGANLCRLRPSAGEAWVEKVAVPGWKLDGVVVYAIAPGPDGSIWVASSEGLSQWHGHQWRHLGRAEGLEDPEVIAVAPAGDGTVWASLHNVKHLIHVGLKEGRLAILESFKDPHPLVSSIIAGLKVDATGALWLGTSLGVKRWDGSRLERFGRDWGLPGEDCAQNALWLDPDGDLWVGLSVGLAHYDTAAILPSPGGVPSDITSIQDGRGEPYAPGPTPFQVPWRWRTLTFAVTSLSYLNEGRIQRQVRLVGFEDQWRDLEGREARYPAMPAGTFRFEVRSGRGDGTWGPVQSQAFEVLRPWWQTYWFYGLAVGLSAWALFGAIRWREQFLLRRMVELEAQVHERTWDLEEANKALEEASMVDPLTGLKNRRFLRLSMPEAEARSVRFHRHSQGEVARGEDLLFLLVDLDHFKDVNDVHGHAAGDSVLRQVAEVLRGACRESDTVVRWGGEEFLIVATGADRFTASVIADNLCQRIREHPFSLPDGKTLHKSGSVGFAAFPLLPGLPTAHPWEGAVEVADQCLYAAKKSGRDGWVGVFRGDLEASEALRERLPKDVPGLVAEAALTLQCSFPDPQGLKWKSDQG